MHCQQVAFMLLTNITHSSAPYNGRGPLIFYASNAKLPQLFRSLARSWFI